MREAPSARLLPDGRRLLLQHGPINLVIEAKGDAEAVRAAYEAATRRFEGLLEELCGELPLLRARAFHRHSGAPKASPEPIDAIDGGSHRRIPSENSDVSVYGFRALAFGEPRNDGAGIDKPMATGPVARCMQAAVAPFAAGTFITPMAAVAGAVAEDILGTMCAAAPLRRAFVNNGGDIALHLAEGESFRIGLVDRPDRPSLFGTTTVHARDPVRGIATSGYPGRSFSRGIAEAVTVLAPTASMADAAATVIANAVDLPGHPAVGREPARDLQPDSDLGDLLVTRSVGPLRQGEIEQAIAAGLREAARLRTERLIVAVAIHLQGISRVLAQPDIASTERTLAHV